MQVEMHDDNFNFEKFHKFHNFFLHFNKVFNFSVSLANYVISKL